MIFRPTVKFNVEQFDCLQRLWVLNMKHCTNNHTNLSQLSVSEIYNLSMKKTIHISVYTHTWIVCVQCKRRGLRSFHFAKGVKVKGISSEIWALKDGLTELDRLHFQLLFCARQQAHLVGCQLYLYCFNQPTICTFYLGVYHKVWSEYRQLL